MPKKQRAKPVASRTKPKGGAVTKKTAVKRLEGGVNKEKDIKKANALVSETKDIEKGLDENMDKCLEGIKKATQNFWMLANNPEAFESSMLGETGLLHTNCVHFEGFVGQIEKIYEMSKRNSRNMGGMLQVSEFISTLV